MSVKKHILGFLDFVLTGEINEKRQPPEYIHRIAINPLGNIGSMYDGITDAIKGRVNTNGHNVDYQPRTKQICQIKKHDIGLHDLLAFIGIDHQLRLSILLNMIKPTGIASAITYPEVIDEHTRFFYFYKESQTIYYNDMHQLKKPIVKSASESCSTHIVTGLTVGIHLLVVLRLQPQTETDGSIDVFLSKIQRDLNGNRHLSSINSNDRVNFKQIISTHVYSNIRHLDKINKFEDFYTEFIKIQQVSEHRPLRFILTPIAWFYGKHGDKIQKLVSCKPDETQLLEQYLIQQISDYRRFDFCIRHTLPNILQGKLHEQLQSIQNDLCILKVLQENQTQEFRNLLRRIRLGNESYKIIQESILDPPDAIKQIIKTLETRTKDLETKGKILRELQMNGFEYCNVAEFDLKANSQHDLVKSLLLGDESDKIVFMSDDTLRNENIEKWTIIYSDLLNKQQMNHRLRLVYADFAYTAYKLKQMEVIQSPPQTNGITTKHTHRPLPPPPTDDCINILLLGESGVGKSTFINAFANYLRFQSLTDAEKGQPIVIIPVSYIMTVNDDFEERIVRFGEPDPNENHNDVGQSVTQKCYSYLFNLSKDRKLRFIDTPGFGDTRGSQQDNLNMDVIFSYLNNFTHIHGVCLLFKPEVAQLNPYFRSCCTQLFDYFGEHIRDNIMFCFTNTRSTFFMPGGTRPLLQEFFATFPVKNIPFTKENTFCFDSESFRYLVALQNDIQFEVIQRDEFERSWQRSVTESERFRDFMIRLKSYRRTIEWQSLKDIQFHINYMLRPCLETARNSLRNVILSKDNSFIKISASQVNEGSILCYSCNRQNQNVSRVGPFYILLDEIHPSSNSVSSNSFFIKHSTEISLVYCKRTSTTTS